MSLDDELPAFIEEAGELLEGMEDALRRIEPIADHAETIVSIFHAAHAINGSAGLFSLDHIVDFTHISESLLDSLRTKKLRISCDLEAILPRLFDRLRLLIDVKMLCELADHFDRIEDFSRIAQRLLGTARHKNLSSSHSLEAIFRGVLDPLRDLIHLQVLDEHTNSSDVQLFRVALVRGEMQ